MGCAATALGHGFRRLHHPHPARDEEAGSRIFGAPTPRAGRGLMKARTRTPALPPGAETIDLSQAVLACFVLEGAKTVRAHPVRPSAFFTEAHRTIYHTMAAMAERGEPVDAHTLLDALRRAGQLDAIGGAAALAAMIRNPLARGTPPRLPGLIPRPT